MSNCLLAATTLDVSYNNISEFPAAMIYNMPTLKNLYFQHNHLSNVPGNAFPRISNLEIIDFSYNFLTSFEFWALLVKKSADFSNNRISIITNTAFYNISQYTSSDPKIYLSNNSETVNFTDAVYEMYDSCSEVYYWLNSSSTFEQLTKPNLTYAIANIDFGTTRINCSCDQAFMVEMISTSVGHTDAATTALIPIYSAHCTDGTRFVDNPCVINTDPPNSSVDFSKVYPRLCKIYEHEVGDLTNISSIAVPRMNVVRNDFFATC